MGSERLNEIKAKAAALDKNRERDNAAYKALMAAQSQQAQAHQTLDERIGGLEAREKARDEQIAAQAGQIEEMHDLVNQLMELAAENVDRMARRDEEFDHLNTSVLAAIEAKPSGGSGAVIDAEQIAAISEKVACKWLEEHQPVKALPAPAKSEWTTLQSMAELAHDGAVFQMKDDFPDEGFNADVSYALAAIVENASVFYMDGKLHMKITSETMDLSEPMVTERGLSLDDFSFIRRGENATGWQIKETEFWGSALKAASIGKSAFDILVEQEEAA